MTRDSSRTGWSRAPHLACRRRGARSWRRCDSARPGSCSPRCCAGAARRRRGRAEADQEAGEHRADQAGEHADQPPPASPPPSPPASPPASSNSSSNSNRPRPTTPPPSTSSPSTTSQGSGTPSYDRNRHRRDEHGSHGDGRRGRSRGRARSVGHRRAGAPAASAHSARDGHCRRARDLARKQHARVEDRAARVARGDRGLPGRAPRARPPGRPHGRPLARLVAPSRRFGASRLRHCETPPQGVVGTSRLRYLKRRDPSSTQPPPARSRLPGAARARRCERRQPEPCTRRRALESRAGRGDSVDAVGPVHAVDAVDAVDADSQLHAHVHAARAERADGRAARGAARSRAQGEGPGQGPQARGAAPPSPDATARRRTGARRGSAARRAHGGAAHRRRRHARRSRSRTRSAPPRPASCRRPPPRTPPRAAAAAPPCRFPRSPSRRPPPSSASAPPSPHGAASASPPPRSRSSSSSSRGSDMRTRLLAPVAVLAAALLMPSAALAVVDAPTDVASPSPTATSPVTVTWTDVAVADGYRVFRANANCTTGLTNISDLAGGDVLPGVETFADSSPLTGTHCYFVRAVVGIEESPDSNHVLVTYDLDLPSGSVTSPVDGAFLSTQPGPLVVTSADASDATSGVQSVQFFASPAGAQQLRVHRYHRQRPYLQRQLGARRRYLRPLRDDHGQRQPVDRHGDGARRPGRRDSSDDPGCSHRCDAGEGGALDRVHSYDRPAHERRRVGNRSLRRLPGRPQGQCFGDPRRRSVCVE